jgi:hypothetical protein
MQTRRTNDLTHLTYQDLLTQLDHLLTPPQTSTLTTAPTMSTSGAVSGAVNRVVNPGSIPRFTGRQDEEWLDTFELGMLDRGLVDDDKEIAKYFARLMGKGAPQSWFTSLDETTKSSYALLKEQWLAEYEEEETTKLDSTLTSFLALRFTDTQVGAIDPNTKKFRHITFADQAADLAADIPSSEMSDRVKTRDFYERMGPSLRTYLYGLGHRQSSVKTIAKAIRDLTSNDITQILEPVRMASRIRQLEESARPSTCYVPQQSQPQPQQQSFSQRPPMQPAVAPAQDRRSLLPTGVVDQNHLREIEAWETKFGRNMEPTLETQYPLTPDTSAPATGECFRCGKRGHRRKECSGVPIPTKEGNYRYLLYLSKQGNAKQFAQDPNATPATSSNSLPLPLRRLDADDAQGDESTFLSETAEADMFNDNPYLMSGNGRGYPQ